MDNSLIVTYFILGSFLAALSIGMLLQDKEKITSMNVLGSILVVLFWPWIFFMAIGRGIEKRGK